MGTVALLYSGGLDSVSAAWLLPLAEPLYVRLGHAYEANELRTARQLAPSLRVVDGPAIGQLEEADGHIRHRNAALIVTAAAHGYTTILVGAVRGEASPDKSGAFFSRMQALLTTSEAERHVVSAPFSRMTKSQLLRAALAAGMPESQALASRSCYSGALASCGACQACYRRWVALVNAGLPAEERPQVPPWSWRQLRRAGVRRWPDVAVNNLEAVWATVRAR